MSTELSFFEGQFDAFTNALWGIWDQKLGKRLNPQVSENPGLLTAAFDQVEQIWDSVMMRLSFAFLAPYVLRYFVAIEDPCRLALRLVGFCIVWPWIYQCFIYTWFLDPLRYFPSPKVVLQPVGTYR